MMRTAVTRECAAGAAADRHAVRFQAMQLYASGFRQRGRWGFRVPTLDAFIALAKTKSQAWSSDRCATITRCSISSATPTRR